MEGVEENLYEEYHGVHRGKIPWNPRIDYGKCVNCGICLEYCKLGVYEVENKGEKKTFVKNPNNCVVFCTGCKGQCPASAITFPSKQKTREIIKELQMNEGRFC